jgi:hypothetical protein
VATALSTTIKRAQWDALAAIVAVVAMNVGLSLFDWFNTPFGSNPLGDLTYYYHSPVALLAVFALAHFKIRIEALIPLVVVLVCLNARNFLVVNRTLTIMHTYPTEVTALPRDVEKPAELEAEFWAKLPEIEGLERPWYERTFGYYREHPMGGTSYVQLYDRMFAPP